MTGYSRARLGHQRRLDDPEWDPDQSALADHEEGEDAV